MADLKRLTGLFVALAAAVIWALLAARTPTNTYHFAPMVVAGAWVAIDGSIGAGLTQRRIVNTSLGGWCVAVATAVVLEVKGDLDGPTFWDSSDTAPVLLEHVVFAMLGAAIGAVIAIRAAGTVPRGA